MPTIRDISDQEWEAIEALIELSNIVRIHPTDNQTSCSEASQHKPVVPTKKQKNNAVADDLVPIGEGHARVPSRLLRRLKWSTYTSATRKLLTAVFSRKVLATHSLTGKPSPAFPMKPAKKKLDPAIVNDIVQTVMERCHVEENLVRVSITTKCADEAKMLRMLNVPGKLRGPRSKRRS